MRDDTYWTNSCAVSAWARTSLALLLVTLQRVSLLTASNRSPAMIQWDSTSQPNTSHSPGFILPSPATAPEGSRSLTRHPLSFQARASASSPEEYKVTKPRTTILANQHFYIWDERCSTKLLWKSCWKSKWVHFKFINFPRNSTHSLLFFPSLSRNNTISLHLNFGTLYCSVN